MNYGYPVSYSLLPDNHYLPHKLFKEEFNVEADLMHFYFKSAERVFSSFLSILHPHSNNELPYFKNSYNLIQISKYDVYCISYLLSCVEKRFLFAVINDAIAHKTEKYIRVKHSCIITTGSRKRVIYL